MNDEFLIETPELVSLGYQVADIGSRFMAALVDTILIAIIQAAVLGATWAVYVSTSGGSLTSWLAAILGLVGFALFWGYYLLFEMIWNGQSPGKRWVGLRVIKDSGAPISFVDSAVRNLVRLIDFLPLYYGIGVIVMFLNRRARRLGDLAAGTLVVRERKDVTLDSLVASAPRPRPAGEGEQESLPGLENLDAGDYDLIVRFLRRRHDLANRGALAQKVAAGISARMGLSPQPLSPPEAEKLLLQVADAYRRRHGAAPELD
ncbi:MAG: RDD family protein [Anaerolineae bacterium]|jgi:uncharacterized RDD family membrane protein YckC